jgi:hypothetical protein
VPKGRSVKGLNIPEGRKKCEDDGVKRFLAAMLKLVIALAIGLGFFGLVTSGMACGPSFQAIYEGNARFEHCYALEENGQTVVNDKVDCWRDWSEHYTYGQTRDRISYATARYVALSQSTSAPTDEAMMMGAPGMTPRQSTITAPAPTNAFAPPPKVLDDLDGSMSTRAPRPSEQPTVLGSGADSGTSAAKIAAVVALPGQALPGQDCTNGCSTKLRDCNDACSTPTADAAAGAAKSKTAACTACEKTYRGCMRACFSK